MSGNKDQLIIIVLAIGVLLLLPKLTGMMKPSEQDSGGYMGADESGGGYYQDGGDHQDGGDPYGIPWNLLQQPPDTGYVGMDPPTPEPEPDTPEITPILPTDEDGNLWDVLIDGLTWGAGFIVGEELIRRTVNKIDDLKTPPKPPGGGITTTDPAPSPDPYSITPTYTPEGHEAPGIWNPVYTEGLTAAGLAAAATAAAYKLAQAPIVTGIASKVPTAAGAVIISPEMLGAPAGTDIANIKGYLDQWRTGINQAKTGHPFIGLQTALIGPNPWGKPSPTYQHHGGNISTIPSKRVTAKSNLDNKSSSTKSTPTYKKPVIRRTITREECRNRTSADIRGY